MKASEIKNIDDYIADFPTEVREILEKIRATVQKAAPAAEEIISYQMPAFRLHGNLVYFAAFKNHIGFYALPSGNAAFRKELSAYKQGKGSIQFPLDQKIPYALITKIVKYRVEENLEKEQQKKKK